MTLIFENKKIAPTLTLACAYFLLSIYAARRLSTLHEKLPGIGPSKLFVVNSFLVSLLRCLTFGSMSIFNYLEFHALIRTDMRSSIISTSSSGDMANDMGDTATDLFFEKATLVLFDLPDFCCISAYVLLILVCAEAQLQARHHWLPGDGYHLRRGWLLGFMIFNAVLYSAQVSLYSLLFFPQVNQRILTNCIYLTMTVLNLGIPLFYLVGFLALAIYFAGFPFTSQHAKLRLQSLVRLSVAWSMTRLLWGVVALTSVLQGWVAMAEENEHYYGLTLVLLFVVTEIGPILWGLDDTVMKHLAETSNIAGIGAGDDGRDSSTLQYSLKHSLDWAEEGQAFRSDPGYYGDHHNDPLYDSFGRKKGAGKTHILNMIPSQYGSLQTDQSVDTIAGGESGRISGTGAGTGRGTGVGIDSEERNSRQKIRKSLSSKRNKREGEEVKEVEEMGGEEKEEMEDVDDVDEDVEHDEATREAATRETAAAMNMRRGTMMMREIETAPLFATRGAMVAHVEVGRDRGTRLVSGQGPGLRQALGQGLAPGQGQGLAKGPGQGQRNNDDDPYDSEGEEGQWVEKDNSPASFTSLSPTPTSPSPSPSPPAIASRIAAFEHQASLEDPTATKPTRQAIRSWFDFGLGTGKETGLSAEKPLSSSSSAAATSSSAAAGAAAASSTAGVGKKDDTDITLSNKTAGGGMDVNALYAAAPGGNKYGTPVVANSKLSKQGSKTVISPSIGIGRTVISTPEGAKANSSQDTASGGKALSRDTKGGDSIGGDSKGGGNRGQDHKGGDGKTGGEIRSRQPTTRVKSSGEVVVTARDSHHDEMKDEALHHDVTVDSGMIWNKRADDDDSVGSHTDDSFVSALEGDILRLGSSSLDDASLSSGGSWDTEDSTSRSPTRPFQGGDEQEQEQRRRRHDDQKRRKKREKRMVIMERGGSVLLPDCSPYFESGLGKVARDNNDNEASSGSDSEGTGDSRETFLSPLSQALRQQHPPTDRRTWGQWLGSWGKGGGSNPPPASLTDHRDRPGGGFGLNGSSDPDDVSI